MPRRRERARLLGPLVEPRLLAVLLVGVLASAAIAALDTAVATFALAEHAASWSGLLLALIGVGSIGGGLAYGARPSSAPMASQYRRWLCALDAGAAPLALSTDVVVLGALLVLAGVAVGPVSTCQFNLVGQLAPPGTLTEAFTWLFSAVLAGTSLGSVAAGVTAEHLGPQVALATPALLVLLAATLALALRPPPAVRP